MGGGGGLVYHTGAHPLLVTVKDYKLLTPVFVVKCDKLPQREMELERRQSCQLCLCSLFGLFRFHSN